MRIQRDRHERSTLPLTGVIGIVGMGLLGIGWAVDARRRDRRAHRLHRMLVDLLLNALHSGDPVTERHSRRVADLTDVLADSYDLDDRRRARLRLAALLHDLGKMDDGIHEIVDSRDDLSANDRETMEEHPHVSAEILRPLERIHPGIGAIVEAHHERWDGSGYPRGLRGAEIPLEARLLAAADVFDAMSQPRSYRDPKPTREVLGLLRDGAGGAFDPEVVERVEREEVLDRWEEIARRGRSDERRETTGATPST